MNAVFPMAGLIARSLSAAALTVVLLATGPAQAQGVSELSGAARDAAAAEREQVAAALAADPQNPALLSRFITLSLQVGAVREAQAALDSLRAAPDATPQQVASAEASVGAAGSGSGPAGPAGTQTSDNSDGTGDSDPAIDPSGAPPIGDPTPGSDQ